ncbi:hypothetical protein ABIE35_001862 [Paenarthrobacter sp. 4246]
MVPVGVRGEAGHNALAQLAEVIRDGGHFVDRNAWVDQQDTVPALHHRAVALDEFALMNQNAVSDVLQHGSASLQSFCARATG